MQLSSTTHDLDECDDEEEQSELQGLAQPILIVCPLLTCQPCTVISCIQHLVECASRLLRALPGVDLSRKQNVRDMLLMIVARLMSAQMESLDAIASSLAAIAEQYITID